MFKHPLSKFLFRLMSIHSRNLRIKSFPQSHFVAIKKKKKKTDSKFYQIHSLFQNYLSVENYSSPRFLKSSFNKEHANSLLYVTGSNVEY